jgi:hypothetical protein
MSNTTVRATNKICDFLVGLPIISQQQHQNSLSLMSILTFPESILEVFLLEWTEKLGNWHWIKSIIF